jgi:alginate O-acetyltransferase complex protein AlgI
MSFSTFEYAVFLPLVFLTFFWVGQRFRWTVLLLASVGFYAAIGEPLLLLVLLWVTLTTYGIGILLHECTTPYRRLAVFWAGVTCNLIPLFFLRYAPFIFADGFSAGTTFGLWLSLLHAGTATGVSFYSFQAISYLADVYLDVAAAEKHLGYLALYLGFFPKLLQGPIERAENLLPQLRKSYVFNYENMRSALLLFAWGLLKKVVIADRLGPFVGRVYDRPHEFSGVSLAIATYLYAGQIYCDFSAYTDMAIASARMFNIQVGPNFRSPYLATSIADFWRRWHISLSRWLLDYLFRPLQIALRTRGALATPLALMITFTICGLWHGASLTFIAWGALHGVYMVTSLWTRGIRSRLVKFLKLDQVPVLYHYVRVAICFHLVCAGWVFFRATSLSDAIYILSHVFSGLKESITHLTNREMIRRQVLLGQTKEDFLIVIFGMGLMAAVHLLGKRGDLRRFLFEKPFWFRWSVYYGVALCILLLGVFGRSQFLYFQF